MSAKAFDLRILISAIALAMTSALSVSAQNVAPPASGPTATPRARGEPAPPALSRDGRYGIQILAATLLVHEQPAPGSLVLAQLQEGARLEADQRRGNWYRVHLPDGRSGWIDYVVGKTNPNFSVDSNPGIVRGLPASEVGASVPEVAAPPDATPGVPPPEALPDDRIILRQPMGTPLEAVIPPIDPSQVPPPA